MNKTELLVPWLVTSNPNDNAQVFDEQIYEHEETFQFTNAKSTDLEKCTEVEARSTVLNDIIPNRIRNRFQC